MGGADHGQRDGNIGPRQDLEVNVRFPRHGCPSRINDGQKSTGRLRFANPWDEMNSRGRWIKAPQQDRVGVAEIDRIRTGHVAKHGRPGCPRICRAKRSGKLARSKPVPEALVHCT